MKIVPPPAPTARPATPAGTTTSATERDHAAKIDTRREMERRDDTVPSFKEKDNLGTRHDTERLATMYWMARMASLKKDPFVLYTFERAEDARGALLELPCIHIAEDSNKLICTEVLIFCYYSTEQGKYEAILCGADLNHDLWEQAKTSFIRHGGHPVGQGALEPHTWARHDETKEPQLDNIVFVREDRDDRYGVDSVYRIYSGPDAVSAKAFLGQNPVTQRS